MARISSPMLVFLALAACVATYNTITMLNSSHRGSSEGEDEVFHFDPVRKMPQEEQQEGGQVKRRFHVAVTANESPYTAWQCRVMYYWYRQFRDAPESEMGGFTRVLHSGKADGLMGEIPTVVVDPLPPGEDRGYVVLNRPWAFVQWLRTANITEDYILMAEPDHLFIRPLPNLATEEMPAAYKFFYIVPTDHEKVLRKYYPKKMGPVTNIDPVGNSPVIIKKSQLEKIAPTWSDISIKMKDDPETDKAFGWVLEMYGYATAAALHGVRHTLFANDLMLQPPWDTDLGKSRIIHYTYGCDYTMQGKLTYGKVGEWRFDKRDYTGGAPPKNLTLPPPAVPETARTLVEMINEATANIPGWKEGE